MEKQDSQDKLTNRSIITLWLILLTSIPWQFEWSLLPTSDSGPDIWKATILIFSLLLVISLKNMPKITDKKNDLKSIFIIYATITLFGSAINLNDLQNNLLRYGRYCLVIYIIFRLGKSLNRLILLEHLVYFGSANAMFALIERMLGLLVIPNRLAGGIFPLSPNALAPILVTGILSLIVLTKKYMGNFRYFFFNTLMLFCLIWTFSRTSIVALFIGILIHNFKALEKLLGYFYILVLPVLIDMTLHDGSPQVTYEIITRGFSSKIDLSFSGRFEAWVGFLKNTNDIWKILFGTGLSTKYLELSQSIYAGNIELYTQNIDSSWVSAFAQGGIFGVILLFLQIVIFHKRISKSLRPLLVSLIFISFFESQLNDIAYGLTVLLLLLSTCNLGKLAKPNF